MNLSLPNFLPKKADKSVKAVNRNQVTVGLDIGHSHINVVQVLRVGDSAIIEKYAHQPVNPGIPISPQIKSLFESAQISLKKVRVSVKGQGVILRFITFPRMTREEFESAIQYEAEKYLPFAVSEVVLDFHIVETQSSKPEGKTMDVILVAARKQEVLKLIKTLEDSGLQPEFIDVDAISFANAFVATNKEAAEKVFTLIDFGAKDVNINIVERGVLRFSRDITFGGHDVTQLLRRKLQIDEAQAFAIQSGAAVTDAVQAEALKQSFSSLIQEIKTSINYFYGQHTEVEMPSAIYVSGGLSKIGLLSDGIEQETKIQVRQYDPIESFTIGAEIKKEELVGYLSYLPVAIGLAVR